MSKFDLLGPMSKSDADAIVELATHIRDYVNAPRKLNVLVKEKPKWNQLCSAMDAIGDAELGIEAYVSMPNSENEGISYLIAYGLLQLLFAQQDALQVLKEALKQKECLPSALWKIRNLRNYSIGHATRSNDGASQFYCQMQSVQTRLSTYVSLARRSDGISLRRPFRTHHVPARGC